MASLPSAFPTNNHEDILYDTSGCESSLILVWISFGCIGAVLLVSIIELVLLFLEKIEVEPLDFEHDEQLVGSATEELIAKLTKRRLKEMKRLRRLNTFAGLYIPQSFPLSYKLLVLIPRSILLLFFPIVLFFFDFQCPTYEMYSAYQSNEDTNFFDKKSVSKVACFIPFVVFLLWHLLGPLKFWEDPMLLRLDHSGLVEEQIEFYKYLKGYRWVITFLIFYIFSMTIVNGLSTYAYSQKCYSRPDFPHEDLFFRRCDADYSQNAAYHLALFELARCGTYTFVFIMLAVVFLHLKAYHLLISMFMGDVSLILAKSLDDMTSRTFKPGEMGFRYDAKGIVLDVEDGKQASELKVQIGWQIIKVNSKFFVQGQTMMSDYSNGQKDYTILFDTDTTRDPGDIIEDIKSTVVYLQSFVLWFFMLVLFLTGGLIGSTMSITYENSTIPFMVLSSTVLAFVTLCIVVPIVMAKAFSERSYTDVNRVCSQTIWMIGLIFVMGMFYTEGVQVAFQMLVGGLVMVSVFLYFLISNGYMSVRTFFDIFTRLQDQPDQAVLGVVDIFVPKSKKSMVKQGYLRSKNISSKAYKAYQEKSLLLATQALTETKDLVESYNAILEDMLESTRGSPHHAKLKAILGQAQRMGREATILSKTVQQTINVLLLDEDGVSFEEVQALMLQQVERAQAIFKDPSTLSDPKVVGGMLDDLDMLLELLDNCGLECTSVQMSLRACRETYESLVGDGSISGSNFPDIIRSVAEKQVTKQMESIFDRVDLPEEQRALVKEHTVKIIAYARAGQIPSEEIEELKHIAAEFLPDDYAEIVVGVNSLESFLHAMAHTFLKDRERLITLAEKRFLMTLDKIMKKYFIPEDARGEILNTAQKVLDAIKAGKIPDDALDDLCKGLQKYAGDKFDPNDVYFLFNFTTGILSTLGSRGLDIHPDQLMPLLKKLMDKYDLPEEKQTELEGYAKKVLHAITMGGAPVSDLEDLCGLLKTFVGDQFDDNDLVLIKTFVSALVTTFSMQSAEPEQLMLLLDGIMKKYDFEDDQINQINLYAQKILTAVEVQSFPELEVQEMLDLMKSFAGDKLDPSDLEVILSLVKVLMNSLKKKSLVVNPEELMPLLNNVMHKYEMNEKQQDQVREYAEMILEAINAQEMPDADLESMCKVIEMCAGDRFDPADREMIFSFISTVMRAIQAQVDSDLKRRPTHSSSAVTTYSNNISKLSQKRSPEQKKDPTYQSHTKKGLREPLLAGEESKKMAYELDVIGLD